MKKFIVLLSLILIFISIPAYAASQDKMFDNWSKTDTFLLGLYTTTWYMDWGQTTYIAEHPNEYSEDMSEWAIGKHPSVGKVNNYFLAQYVLNVFAADYLKPKYRKMYLLFLFAEHAYCVQGNRNIGIKFTVPLN